MFDSIETGSFESRYRGLAQPHAIRVVSWNIARGAQTATIKEFLAAADADLILLQECDRNARRTASRNIAREIAQSLRMNYAFAIEFEELSQRCNGSPAFHGQATLSRWPLSTSRIIRFRRQSSFWSPRWWIPPLPAFQRRAGGRIALVNSLLVGNKNLILYNLHLESRNGDNLRVAQLSEVLEDTHQYDPEIHIVIAGDFNFDVTGNDARNLLHTSGFDNPFAKLRKSTISDSSDWRALDWILTRCGPEGKCPTVHDTVRGSDHYPLSLTVNVP